jgi:acyl-coenzyme A thioesterase PaaI-like protein
MSDADQPADPADPADTPARFPWATSDPGRLLGKGHPAGDFLEAHAWDVLDEDEGFLRIGAHLPAQVKNPRGQLFGGFTPTYVDMIALFTTRAGSARLAGAAPWRWLATTSMQLDYFEPITGPTFVIESRLEKRRGRTNFVITRFLQDGELAVLAATTMRELDVTRPLGDA